MTAAEEALAHCQIMSLLSLYYHALDVADFDRLERDVMSEDATWNVIQLATTMKTLANGFVEAEHVHAREGWRIRFYEVTEQITDKDMLAFKQTLGLEYK